MLHDDNEYVEPEKFNPNRFLDKNGQLDPNVLDPARMAFGFGRRCVILPLILCLVVAPCSTTYFPPISLLSTF